MHWLWNLCHRQSWFLPWCVKLSLLWPCQTVLQTKLNLLTSLEALSKLLTSKASWTLLTLYRLESRCVGVVWGFLGICFGGFCHRLSSTPCQLGLKTWKSWHFGGLLPGRLLPIYLTSYNQHQSPKQTADPKEGAGKEEEFWEQRSDEMGTELKITPQFISPCSLAVFLMHRKKIYFISKPVVTTEIWEEEV